MSQENVEVVLAVAGDFLSRDPMLDEGLPGSL